MAIERRSPTKARRSCTARGSPTGNCFLVKSSTLVAGWSIPVVPDPDPDPCGHNRYSYAWGNPVNPMASAPRLSTIVYHGPYHLTIAERDWEARP